MRELDVLLLRYLERRLPHASRGERDAFARLLELPDPELFGYLAGRGPRAAADPMTRMSSPVFAAMQP